MEYTYATSESRDDDKLSLGTKSPTLKLSLDSDSPLLIYSITTGAPFTPLHMRAQTMTGIEKIGLQE